jgi:hypothetical protein
MKISTIQVALLLLVAAMTACTSTPAPPASPTVVDMPVPSPTVTLSPTPTIVSPSEPASLPDLVIKVVYLEMSGRQGNCVEAYSHYEIRVSVENLGTANAGPFVVEMNGTQQQVDEGLTAGQVIMLHFGTTPSGQYVATVDASDQVAELEEDNNSLSYLAPTPTPPLLCTPTATP